MYNVLSLLALVRADVGITVLPRLSLPPSEHDLRFIALEDPLARRTVGLLSRSSEVASPATEAFARVLHRIVMTIGDELDLELDEK
ncbi:LysR substrate-binding domain-containing protein [Pseudaminobacter sp. NGMCC 1.201702]|uniref:LysR substrate-binding domain-containing protein n=1 Tax=Pseudaminobacter sp. NGMCC 1.201702 TaxID=3391825 RepID=UPI0039F0A87C